jgi:hypothetical protein
VVATDVSAAAVARARAGRYTTAELAGLPPIHRRWLHPVGDLWEVDPTLRHRVRVEQANLTVRFPVKPGRCQVVFCRNVLIYLAASVTQAFLDRLAGWLAPGGLVFLGYSEAVLAPTARLQVEPIGDTRALRVVAGGSGRLWTTPDASRLGRLRSPTGGPGADPPGWRAAEEPPGSRPPQDPATAADMAEAGEVAAARGDLEAAVVAFRRPVFLDPDQPGAWFQLGLALGAVEDRRGALRAYAAGLAALDWCDRGVVQAGLDGWTADELAGVLRAKLGRP